MDTRTTGLNEQTADTVQHGIWAGTITVVLLSFFSFVSECQTEEDLAASLKACEKREEEARTTMHSIRTAKNKQLEGCQFREQAYLDVLQSRDAECP